MRRLPEGNVSFLFSDIEGSTRLLGQYPEIYAAALLRHDALMREAVEQARGAVFETVGDAVYAVFDTPADAVAACAWRCMPDPSSGEATTTSAPPSTAARASWPSRTARRSSCRASSRAKRRTVCRRRRRYARWGLHRLKDLAEPEYVFQLVHRELPADFPPLRSLDPRATNLPAAPNAFVGRHALRAEVRRALEGARLLTLTGPGGVGKTRLAVEVAAESLAAFDDGVWFVPLAATRDPTVVASDIAAVFKVVERQGEALERTLASHFRAKHLLLVLDNFEQVVEAALLVAALLAECPRLAVLVTSRAPLRLQAERQIPVPPLEIVSDAVTLFIQRALAVRPGLSLEPANREAIRQICVRVDALPLAIELAASRCKFLGPQAILERLGARLPLLSAAGRDRPERQRSMRAAIAWSYELLDDRQRDHLERLGVFVGGGTLDAIAAVWGERDVLDQLGELVDASLVDREDQPDGEPRFVMLETIREYALERLAERGRLDEARAAHAAEYLRFGKIAEAVLRGEHMAAQIARVSREHPNLGAALDWFVARGDQEAVLTLCWDLGWFWLTQGHLRDGLRRIDAALAMGHAGTPRLPALVLLIAGQITLQQGDVRRSRELHEASLALMRSVGERRWTATLIHDLGQVALREGDARQARELTEESLALTREGGHAKAIAHRLLSLAEIARFQGDHVAAARYLDECLSLRPGSDLLITATLERGLLALDRGDHARAFEILRENVSRWRELDAWLYVSTCLVGLAGVAIAEDDVERGARLLGAASFDAAWREGRALTVEEASALAGEAKSGSRA